MCWRVWDAIINGKRTKSQRANEEKIKFKLCQGRFGVGVNANYNRLMRDIVFSSSSLWLSVCTLFVLSFRADISTAEEKKNTLWDCCEVLILCKWKRGRQQEYSLYLFLKSTVNWRDENSYFQNLHIGTRRKSIEWIRWSKFQSMEYLCRDYRKN